MSGTWPAARTALVSHLDGVTATAAGFVPGTLQCEEFPPTARRTNFPFAYVIPPARRVERHPGSDRVTTLDVRVRVLIGPTSTPMRDRTVLEEAWVVALIDAMDDALALDGNADIWLAQEFSEQLDFPGDEAWGVEMTIEGLRISEIKSFGA